MFHDNNIIVFLLSFSIIICETLRFVIVFIMKVYIIYIVNNMYCHVYTWIIHCQKILWYIQYRKITQKSR